MLPIGMSVIVADSEYICKDEDWQENPCGLLSTEYGSQDRNYHHGYTRNSDF
jgi:hypothetical protein